MERITKADLEKRVEILNTLCGARHINKSYQIGYRNGMCYLDKQSNTHKYCIEHTVTCGTKRQVSDAMFAMISVIL